MKRSLIFQLALVGVSLIVLIYVAFAPRVQRVVPTRIILETEDERIVVGTPAPDDEPTTGTLSQTGGEGELEGEDGVVEPEEGMGALARAAMETRYNAETTYQGAAGQTPPPPSQ